jgi:hypothetical protein
MAQEPLWTSRAVAGGGKAWPQPAGESTDYKPLAGVKVIDFSRVIAAPAVSKILAVLGADVIRISHSENPDYAATMVDLQTGKRDANLNVKSSEGKQAFIELVKDADVLIDGFRPGAFERLGFTSESLRKINPSLIYVRENCYGFKGPLSYRSGWQQVSDCLVGMSYLQGKFLGLDEAVLPLFRKLPLTRRLHRQLLTITDSQLRLPNRPRRCLRSNFRAVQTHQRRQHIRHRHQLDPVQHLVLPSRSLPRSRAAESSRDAPRIRPPSQPRCVGRPGENTQVFVEGPP